ncbi:MAG: FAD-dependent monooxygenase, partial [Acidimicrobiia bacterium]
SAKFIWLATTKLFDGLTFIHERGPDGVFAVHGYPYQVGGNPHPPGSSAASTFIVETDEESWRRAGLDAFDVSQPPGPSDLASKTYLEALFADHLEGHPLLVNNSRWGNFRTLRCGRWRSGNVVILGDAAHTAHFSVGSGTKMALEDAAALVQSLTEHAGDLDAALEAFEAARRPPVAKIQGAAGPSLSWWEHFGRYHDHLEGQPLLVNNSRWGNFRTLRCGRWRSGNVVILGDAAHTAHFSVGSGTKMAMEDAAALVQCLTDHAGRGLGDLDGALEAFETTRRPPVAKIQGAAGPSLSWWEHFGRYHDHLDAPQFAFHFFSRAIPLDKLAKRDPRFVADVSNWWATRFGAPPLATPLTLGGRKVDGRVVSVTAPASGEGVPLVRNGGDEVVPFRSPGEAPVAGAAWGLWLTAPDDEAGLPGAVAELEAGVAAGATVVAVSGGSPVTRVLLCEEARMARGTPALLVDDSLRPAQAATLVLSGRADLVGASEAVAESWMAAASTVGAPA